MSGRPEMRIFQAKEQGQHAVDASQAPVLGRVLEHVQTGFELRPQARACKSQICNGAVCRGQHPAFGQGEEFRQTRGGKIAPGPDWPRAGLSEVAVRAVFDQRDPVLVTPLPNLRQ